MTDKELFYISHDVSVKSNKKIYTCKLCGTQHKRINDLNLAATIGRENPGLYWCQNTACINRLSSIHASIEPKMCVPKVIYIGQNRVTKKSNYKFDCKICGLSEVLTFEEIVEHEISHILYRDR